MTRMIFSTVRAPHEPALTVESLAISATGRPSIVAVPGHDSVSGQVRGGHVGEHAVLDERPLVDQQPHPLAGEELALPGVGLVVLRRTAALDPGAQLRRRRVLGEGVVLLRLDRRHALHLGDGG